MKLNIIILASAVITFSSSAFSYDNCVSNTRKLCPKLDGVYEINEQYESGWSKTTLTVTQKNCEELSLISESVVEYLGSKKSFASKHVISVDAIERVIHDDGSQVVSRKFDWNRSYFQGFERFYPKKPACNNCGTVIRYRQLCMNSSGDLVIWWQDGPLDGIYKRKP